MKGDCNVTQWIQKQSLKQHSKEPYPISQQKRRWNHEKYSISSKEIRNKKKKRGTKRKKKADGRNSKQIECGRLNQIILLITLTINSLNISFKR